MNGVTCTFWLTGEDVKAFVERNGYQHKTVRMFLYDYGMIGTKEGRIMRKVFRK